MTLYAGLYIRSNVGKTIKSSAVSHLWELWEEDEMFSIFLIRSKFPKKITVHAELMVRDMKSSLEMIVRNHTIRITKKNNCFELRVDGTNFGDLPVYDQNKKITESTLEEHSGVSSLHNEPNLEVLGDSNHENHSIVDLLTQENEIDGTGNLNLSQIPSNAQILQVSASTDALNPRERYFLPDACLGMTPSFDFYPKPNINPFFTGNQFLPRFKK